MQKREDQNSLLITLKRPRQNSISDPPQKKHIEKPLPFQSSTSNTFRSQILQNGDAKAFWCIPSLRFDIDNNKDIFFESPAFRTGNGDKWNILLWPCKTSSTVGLFVQMEVSEENFTYKKSATVYFEAYFTVGSKLERKVTLNLNHIFSFPYRDSGYDDFIKHNEYLQYLNKPTVFEITVSPARPHEESKEATGYNGIINEGTTCYMNSLLQTLYFLNYFRKAVYAMPTALKDQDRLPLALQMIFYHLQFCDTPANTRELLTSFGWNSDQWNVQHDVQEFNCILSDHLENKMKGTPAEGTYTKLFVGKMESFIKCKNVSFTSTRTENFTDIQLNVKGCDDIYNSFDKYIEIESLTGDNKYEAEGFGLQDAEKGVMFLELPPVLQLQLKRFEYDYYCDKMVKLNHKYNFYDDIDLNKYVKTQGDWKYSLLSILVHKGNAVTGHYFSYISPELNGKWYVFNDDSVDRILDSQAKISSLGGDFIELEVSENGFVKEVITKNETCAYMLVYIKTDMKNNILQDLGQEDIPEHLKDIFDSENKRRENEIKQKAFKDSLLTIYLLSFDVIQDYSFPGITIYDNDFYGYDKFTMNSGSRALLEMKKELKGYDLEMEIKKHVSTPVKLWTFIPGYKNWQFKPLDLNDTLIRQLTNRAVYIETQESIFYMINSQWKFIEENIKSPSSQGTEILEEESNEPEKIFLFFKWYKWDGIPSIKLIKGESITKCSDINDLRKHFYMFKMNRNEDFSGKMRIYIEKSSENFQNPNDLNITAIESYENFEVTFTTRSLISATGKISLSNGDIIIGEEIIDPITSDYITAKQHLGNLYQSIYINVAYYNKYHKYGFESFSYQILNIAPEGYFLKLNIRLQDSQSELKQQIANIISKTQSVSLEQIVLFYTENPHSNNMIPLPGIDNTTFGKKPCKTVSDILKLTNSVFYDILPYPSSLIEKKTLVFFAYVNNKFSLIKQHYKIIDKSQIRITIETITNDLQSQKLTKPSLINPLSPVSPISTLPSYNLSSPNDNTNGSSSETIVYYLLNHPQNGIIKEIQLNDSLQSYIDNPNYILCYRILSPLEKNLTKTQTKLFILTYKKGSNIFSSEVMYFNHKITCKELISTLSQNYEEKARVMILIQSPYADRIEIKPIRPLEDSENHFFERYPEKLIGIELPCSYVYKNELKIKET
ncbi:hypothetical protein SteCoe_33440 [Stentor coeruleus]|uniref:Ubiquitinyl hydrolase 1 n=1 Tax=Stentor coeruleus TaxID=5963 RepID=A0A1R2AX44_9CILI|nr:hypothetical protein SteCoe_33440 [Stentor coeruleus]